MDNQLAFLDQAAFLRLRATGQQSVCQCTWVYDRPIDLGGLHQFHRNLGQGLLGRRIERSPLPFGRDRWVACTQLPGIDFVPWNRPRSEIGAWTDERANLRVDPESGPGWHLGVLGLDDGGTAICLVASHCIVDGLAFSYAIAEAAKGEARIFGYPPPHLRSWTQAVLADGREFIHGLPEIVRALIATVWMLLRMLFGSDRAAAPAPLTTPADVPDAPVVLPSLTTFIDLDAWDTRRRELDGSSSALHIAVAARLAERLRRVAGSDGSVSITVPVSERTPEDTRANALTNISFRISPKAELQEIRGKVKQGLVALQDTPNELMAPLPLIPLVPRWLARNMEGLAMGNADLPVGCSNIGDVEPAVGRADGTDADYVLLRLCDQGVTTRGIERGRGQLFVSSGRINDKVFLTTVAYQPGAENSKERLRRLVTETLGDFRLPTLTEV
jgi:diacylglycerol O-acyltransferase